MIWHSDALDNHHGGVILHEGYLYGSGTNARGWFCLDLIYGEVQWKIAGKGSITYSDGMLYMLDERGTMKPVEGILIWRLSRGRQTGIDSGGSPVNG